MNTGGETASILMAFSAEVSKEGLKSGVELLKFLIMGYLNKKGVLNAGEVNMKKMLESGEEIKTLDLNTKDAERFAAMAKDSGITFAFFQKGEEVHTIAYLANEAELVNKMLDIIKQEKVKGIENVENILNEYRLGSDKTFIVDKNNPENYIQVNTKEILKTYLVDKSNPDNYVKIKEDLKNNSIEAEITVNGKTKTVSGKDAVKNEMIKNAKNFKTPEVVENESEIDKLKETYIKKDDKKTMEQIEKSIKEVREKMPKQQKKQRSKSKERSNR